MELIKFGMVVNLLQILGHVNINTSSVANLAWMKSQVASVLYIHGRIYDGMLSMGKFNAND